MAPAAGIAVVLLAAGQSRRFGGNKQLFRLDGKSLVRRMAETALACRAEKVIVVLGAAAAEVAAELVGLPLELAENPEFAAGQSGSVRRGLAAAQPAEAILFLPVDMPFLRPETLDRLIAAWQGAPEAAKPAAIVPLYGGQPGAPVLVGRRLFPEVALLEGDQGARVLLRRPAAEIVELPVADAGEGRDLDRPEDLPPPSD